MIDEYGYETNTWKRVKKLWKEHPIEQAFYWVALLTLVFCLGYKLVTAIMEVLPNAHFR